MCFKVIFKMPTHPPATHVWPGGAGVRSGSHTYKMRARTHHEIQSVTNDHALSHFELHSVTCMSHTVYFKHALKFSGVTMTSLVLSVYHPGLGDCVVPGSSVDGWLPGSSPLQTNRHGLVPAQSVKILLQESTW